jgi:hypothetical protein
MDLLRCPAQRRGQEESELKKTLVLISLIALLGAFSYAQEFGSVKGTVTDQEGNPLPGVSVTLTGGKISPMTVTTSERGNFRFVSLPVGFDYTVKFELQGFRTVIHEKQVISYGRDINFDIKMEQAALEESVTVVGQSPVIDTKRTQVGVNITEQMLMSLPTSRNPWVLMALAPGMMIDREDVGGSDAGQQSSYYGHGSSGGDATWNVDGANITDNSALGAAPAYLNMSSFDEIQINYGNNDIKTQTGGVQVNLITKRGGNNYTGSFYLDAEDKNWQSSNLTDDLISYGYKGAGINKVYLYGANFGGPIIRDKAWFYGSYGIQDIGTVTLAGTQDNTWLQSGYARLDLQLISQLRMNFFYEYDSKIKNGRTNWGATMQGPETVWDQTGPTPIYKAEADLTLGNLYLNAKAVYNHNTFYLLPRLGKRTSDGTGPLTVYTYYPEFYASGNIADYGTVRPQTNFNLNGNLFVEDVLGGDHEFKFGADYVKAQVSSFSLYEANLVIAEYSPTWTEAWVIRDYYNNFQFNRYSVFAQDTITWGRLSINIGLRYDQESSIVANVNQPAAPFLSKYLVNLKVDKFDPGMKSKILSPRFSLIYDLFGDGKSVAKLNIARYGTQTGYEFAGHLNPVPWAEIDIRWIDSSGDGRVQENELVGSNGLGPDDISGWSWYGYFDPDNPSLAKSTNQYDPDYKTPLLDEISLSFEQEIMADFAIRLEGFYKVRHRFIWDKGIFSDGSIETPDNWFLSGTEPETGAPYYDRYEWPIGSYRTNANNAREKYLAGEIVLRKRLSHRWMLDGSFTLSSWKYYYNGDYNFDITNHPFYDGGVIAPQSGGSGITNVFVNAPWMAKLTGLYQLPYGINIAGTFIARSGYVVPPFAQIYRDNVGWTNMYANEKGNVGKFGDTRLPNFFELNARIEKMFNITDTMTVTVAADAFNAFNANTTLSEQARLTSAVYGRTLRIINPRVFRFGVRFNF